MQRFNLRREYFSTKNDFDCFHLPIHFTGILYVRLFESLNIVFCFFLFFFFKSCPILKWTGCWWIYCLVIKNTFRFTYCPTDILRVFALSWSTNKIKTWELDNSYRFQGQKVKRHYFSYTLCSHIVWNSFYLIEGWEFYTFVKHFFFFEISEWCQYYGCQLLR